MNFIEKKNVAQYKGADWSNFVRKEPNCTVEKAKEIAASDPNITFFFYCRSSMVLEGHVYDKYGAFSPGDAVFFNGTQWLGSAPQCDVYEKDAKQEPNHDADNRILVNALTNMLEILGVVLSGQSTLITKVTQAEAETMLRNAITVYRENSELNKLSIDNVNAAIDRVYNDVYSDVKGFFDEEIAEASLMAASQAAMAGGSIFSFFPLVSVIFDATALATMATAMGLQIDIQNKGAKVVAEANGLKQKVDEQPELAPAKKWNDAKNAELLTLGQLNAGMQSYRGDSSLYALIFVLDQKTPGLNDDQLFAQLKQLCKDVNDLAAQLPNLGDKLYDVVSKENTDEIKAAVQAMANVSTSVAQLVGAVVGTVIMAAIVGYGIKKNFSSIKTSWNALETDPIPEGMETRWTKTLTRMEKFRAGIGAIAGVFMTAMEIWQAIRTAEEKDKALKTISDNRDAIKDYYKSILSHQH